MQTQEQKYARQIHDQISKIDKSDKKYNTKYGSMAHKLPILVRTAGLAQALAFADTRDQPQKDLLGDLAETVLGTNMEVKDLLKQSRESPMLEYMRLTQDVMLALTWYKRFAQSILGVDASEDADEGGESS